MAWERKKCVFPKMGTKTHQLGKYKRSSKEKQKQIEKDKAKRLKEWRSWLWVDQERLIILFG